jgi:hypothetical protein
LSGGSIHSPWQIKRERSTRHLSDLYNSVVCVDVSVYIQCVFDMNVMTDSFPERSTMVLKVASVSKPGTLKARLIHICASV